jgi:hypothetical protein
MKPRPPPLFLSPRDEDILRAAYAFRYITAKDLTYLWFSPTILNRSIYRCL